MALSTVMRHDQEKRISPILNKADRKSYIPSSSKPIDSTKIFKRD